MYQGEPLKQEHRGIGCRKNCENQGQCLLLMPRKSLRKQTESDENLDLGRRLSNKWRENWELKKAGIRDLGEKGGKCGRQLHSALSACKRAVINNTRTVEQQLFST